MTRYFTGTSGFDYDYDPWVGAFYPRELKKRRGSATTRAG